MRAPLIALSFAALVACNAGANSSASGAGGSGGAAAGTGGVASASSGDAGDLNLGGHGQGGSLPVPPAEIFAHGVSTLYKLDPDTKVVSVVGDFSGCVEGVVDIAIDKDGQLFGSTFNGLYRIDKTSAVCTFVAAGSFPNSLSFVPKGTLDPDEEALVGYEGANYVRIDTVTGAVTTVGSLGSGYTSSGDIVSVIDGGTYLTVNGVGCGDCIVEVDPKTGALVKMIGPLGHPSVFGLAFWGGAAYGFDNAGELFQIDLADGRTTLLSTGMAVPSFFGAGSTTAAPLTPPK